MDKIKEFYTEHKKPILFFAAFVIFVILAVTVIDGDMSRFTIND